MEKLGFGDIIGKTSTASFILFCCAVVIDSKELRKVFGNQILKNSASHSLLPTRSATIITGAPDKSDRQIQTNCDPTSCRHLPESGTAQDQFFRTHETISLASARSRYLAKQGQLESHSSCASQLWTICNKGSAQIQPDNYARRIAQLYQGLLALQEPITPYTRQKNSASAPVHLNIDNLPSAG